MALKAGTIARCCSMANSASLLGCPLYVFKLITANAELCDLEQHSPTKRPPNRAAKNERARSVTAPFLQGAHRRSGPTVGQERPRAAIWREYAQAPRLFRAVRCVRGARRIFGAHSHSSMCAVAQLRLRVPSALMRRYVMAW
jgi:hypothetical protein